MLKFDSHIHCHYKCIHILANILEQSEVDGGLVLPFQEQSFLVKESIIKNNTARLKCAYSLKTNYSDLKDFHKELCLLDDNLEHFDALKLYKDFSFNECFIGDRCFGLNDEIMCEVFDICIKHKKPMVIHCADPKDFWRKNPVHRKGQMARNSDSHYCNKKLDYKQQHRNKANFIQKYGDKLNVVFAHLGGFPEKLDELRLNLESSVVDTSASIEEVILLNDNMDVKNIMEKNIKNVLFGTDLFVLETASNMEKIMTISGIQYMQSSIAMFENSISLKVPNYIENKWEIEGLDFSHKEQEYIFYKNYTRIFQ